MIKVLKKVNYLRKQRNYKKFIDKILKVVDFTPIENKIPEKVEKVTFIIPGMPLYSGGHTSILRLGTELSKNGYDVRYFSIYDNETLEEIRVRYQKVATSPDEEGYYSKNILSSGYDVKEMTEQAVELFKKHNKDKK